MKKIAVVFALAAVVAGCSNDNKITIENISDEAIHFNFRAEPHTVNGGETKPITDIPNGTYTYATTFDIPYTAKSWSILGGAASGDLTFEKTNTQIHMIYSGYLSRDSVYQVGVTITSTTPNTISPTSP